MFGRQFPAEFPGSGAAVPSGPVPPPFSSNHLAYYESSKGTEDGSGAVADFAKFRYWRDQSGNGHDFDQSTSANQVRSRQSTDIPVVYVDADVVTNTQLPQTTLEFDHRASAFFALVELDQLIVQSVSVSLNLIALGSGVGELRARIVSGEAYSAVLQWIDANGTTTTTHRLRSDLMLVGVILDAAEIRIVVNGTTQTISTPLSAGTSTGIQLFKGGALGGASSTMGYNCLFALDFAPDSSELADIQAWAVDRGVIFSPTKDLIATGASLTLGINAEGNLNAFRQYINARRGQISYRNIGFAGNTTIQQQGHAQGILVGWGYPQPAMTSGSAHNFNNRQVAIILGVTNDITAGTALATIVTNATAIRATAKGYGYDLVQFGVAPVGGWDATQEQKRLDYNAAMAALDERQYGYYLPPPAELTDPTNTTYYHTDQTHLKKAAFDLYLRDCETLLDSLFAVPASSLQSWIKFDGNYEDSSIYTRDWEAVNSPTFVSGLWGRQALRVSASGHARSKFGAREFDWPYQSIMFWYKDRNGSGNISLISKYTGVTGNINFWRHSGGTVRCDYPNLTSGSLTSSSTFLNSAWHCVAFSTDATGGKLYVSTDENPANLTLQASLNWSTVPMASNANDNWRAGLTHPSDGGTPSDVDFQDLLTWFGTKTLAEFQAIDMTTYDGE